MLRCGRNSRRHLTRGVGVITALVTITLTGIALLGTLQLMRNSGRMMARIHGMGEYEDLLNSARLAFSRLSCRCNLVMTPSGKRTFPRATAESLTIPLSELRMYGDDGTGACTTSARVAAVEAERPQRGIWVKSIALTEFAEYGPTLYRAYLDFATERPAGGNAHQQGLGSLKRFEVYFAATISAGQVTLEDCPAEVPPIASPGPGPGRLAYGESGIISLGAEKNVGEDWKLVTLKNAFVDAQVSRKPNGEAWVSVFQYGGHAVPNLNTINHCEGRVGSHFDSSSGASACGQVAKITEDGKLRLKNSGLVGSGRSSYVVYR